MKSLIVIAGAAIGGIPSIFVIVSIAKPVLTNLIEAMQRLGL
jgi:hypothetical protein